MTKTLHLIYKWTNNSSHINKLDYYGYIFVNYIAAIHNKIGMQIC